MARARLIIILLNFIILASCKTDNDVKQNSAEITSTEQQSLCTNFIRFSIRHDQVGEVCLIDSISRIDSASLLRLFIGNLENSTWSDYPKIEILQEYTIKKYDTYIASCYFLTIEGEIIGVFVYSDLSSYYVSEKYNKDVVLDKLEVLNEYVVSTPIIVFE